MFTVLIRYRHRDGSHRCLSMRTGLQTNEQSVISCPSKNNVSLICTRLQTCGLTRQSGYFKYSEEHKANYLLTLVLSWTSFPLFVVPCQSYLLWLVRWPSLLWLVYSALIGQMAQSVMIGLLYSDWSDGPVCCDWSTLLWLVRWSSLLWLVYSALIGQMVQTVVIGLLCSDWSDGPVCCDWSTLL